MRVNIDRDALADAVAWTTRVLPSRPAIPVLSGVVLDASGDTLHLSCFDYEVSARLDAPAQVEEPGKVLVQGKLLADIARTLPASDVSLELDGAKLRLRCGASRFALPVMPVEEYPQLPAAPAVVGTIPGDVFAAAVSQVTTAAARDETPPVLTAVKVEVEGERMSLVSTDRYRLALRELTWSPGQPGIQRSFLVRARTLSEIARSVGTVPEVSLGLTEEGGSLIGVTAGGRRTTAPLMDGEYPPVRRLFPTASDTTVVLETAPLLEGVRRVALISDRTPVRMSFGEGEAILEAGTGEDAQARDAVSATIEGPDLTIAFNAQYLVDGLGVAQSSHVRLSFTEPSKPALLTTHNESDASDDRGFTYLLMPIRMAG